MLLNAYALGKHCADEEAFVEALQDLTFKGWKEVVDEQAENALAGAERDNDGRTAS